MGFGLYNVSNIRRLKIVIMMETLLVSYNRLRYSQAFVSL